MEATLPLPLYLRVQKSWKVVKGGEGRVRGQRKEEKVQEEVVEEEEGGGEHTS